MGEIATRTGVRACLKMRRSGVYPGLLHAPVLRSNKGPRLLGQRILRIGGARD